MIKKLLLIFIFISLSFVLLKTKAFSEKVLGFYKIHQIKDGKLLPGLYNTEGFVAKIYICPPCPKGAMCSPCIENNIVISENKKIINTYDLSKNELIILTNNPKPFKIGNKYRFLIKISSNYSSFEQPYNIELVKYNEF